MTHTALDAGGAGTHRDPPEHVPDGVTGQARAWLPHVGDAAVATPPEGVQDPVGCGAATVTAVAKIGPPQEEEETLCVVPPLEQSGASNAVTTGSAQPTPVAPPQPQLVQLAAGATRSPLPSKRLDALPSHGGGAPPPTWSETGPIQGDAALGAQTPPLPHATTTSAGGAASESSEVTSVVASEDPSPSPAPPSPAPPV